MAKFRSKDLGSSPGRSRRGTHSNKFNFSAHTIVKHVLRKTFLNKCAYCEDTFGSNVKPEIEHFRPKGEIEIPGANGGHVVRSPGYWWLATCWENLTVSCPVCNKEESSTIAGGKTSKCGKGGRFPLAYESMRAKKPGDEIHEVPLLLDPCSESVENFFQFETDGSVVPSPGLVGLQLDRALTTIEVFGLNRADLCKERAEQFRLAELQLVDIEYLSDKPHLDSMLIRHEGELQRFLTPCAKFRAALAQFISKKLSVISGYRVSTESLHAKCSDLGKTCDYCP